MRQGHDVIHIEGPNGAVIDKQQMVSWAATEPR
jgi:hypothetical protein